MLKRTYKRARQEEAAGEPLLLLLGEAAAAPAAQPPTPPLPPLPSPPLPAAPAAPPSGFAAWRAPFATCPFPRTRDGNAALPATAPPAPPPPGSAWCAGAASAASAAPGALASSASAGAPASPGAAPRRVSIQLHLDLGQRAFDSTRCLRCGMVYCPGDAGDERLHAAQCAREAGEGGSGSGSGGGGGGGGSSSSSSSGASALQWPAHARDDVVATGEDGVRVIRVPPVAAAPLGAGGAAAVPPALQARAAAVAAHLLAVLGPHSLPSSSSSSSSSSDGGGGASAPLLLHYYVAVGAGSGAVLGALCVHTLPTPFARLVTSSAGSGSDCAGAGSASAHAPAPAASAAGPPQPLPSPAPLLLRADAPRVRAVLGVNQVWVARSGRRRGVARALLDAARAHAVHAHTVPRAEVAFSQPTGEGFALAGAYRGTPGAVPVFFGVGEEEG